MAQECGLEPRETITSGNGNSEKPTVMECMSGSMEIDMKESSNNASNMVQERRGLHQESYTRANFTKASQAVMVNFFGRMEAIIREILRMVLEMAMEYGSYLQEIVISMKDNM
jgi:hypothetical protein